MAMGFSEDMVVKAIEENGESLHFLVRWLYVCVVEIAIGSAGEGNSEAILETLLTHAVSIKLFPFLIELHQY